MRDASRSITAPDGPVPVGPYSHAVRAGELLFCSGFVGVDPANGALVSGGIDAQVQQTLHNLTAVLHAAGCTLADVVKTTIYLVDINDFAAVNRVYGERFTSEPPARSTVAVAALPLGARVEIEAVASLRSAQ